MINIIFHFNHSTLPEVFDPILSSPVLLSLKLKLSLLQIHEEADVSPRHQSFSSPSRHFEFCSDLNLDTDFTSENIMFKTHSTKWKRWNSSIEVVDSLISNPYPLYKDNEKRKKQLVLIGIAKVPARMELREIRKRQSRRAPVPMFPKVIGDSPDVSGDSNGWRNLWRLLRPLRYSSRLITALGKTSLCCIPRV